MKLLLSFFLPVSIPTVWCGGFLGHTTMCLDEYNTEAVRNELVGTFELLFLLR